MTAVASTYDMPADNTEELPEPLVKPFRHPLRWARNHLQLIAYAVLFAHIGEFIVAALYYLLTQKSAAMHDGWHTLVPDSNLRHAIRDVGEGVLGGFLAQAVVYNYFKKGNRKVGRLTGWLKRRAHVPVTLAALLAAVVLGSIAFAIGYYLLELANVHASDPNITGSVWHRTYESLWATNAPKKLLGLLAAFAARKPLRVIFANIQLWFADRKVDNGHSTHFWEPAVYQARVNYLKEHPNDRHVGYSARQNVAMIGATVIGLALAGYGYYILTYIA